MDIFAFPPIATLLDLTSRGLMQLASLLDPLAGAAAAVAILTLVVRMLLIPAGVAQAKAEQARVRLAPRLRALQTRHRSDPARLQRETMQLYRDEKVSPFAGLLPMLVQAPVIGLLSAVFLHPTIAGHSNALLDQTLLGVPLGDSLWGTLTSGAPDLATLTVCGALVVLIALVGELTRRLLRPPAPAADAPSVPALAAGALGMLQFTTAAFAIFVPLAASISLTVTVAWTLAQRVVLRRRYPLK